MQPNVKKIIISIYATIAAVFLLLIFIVFSVTKPLPLQFYVFDIGQGDAMLIRTPSRHTILIDGGPDNTVVYKLGEYLPFYDRTIDLIILSHPHADHLVGLNEVLDRYNVKSILMTGVFYKSSFYQAWLNKISAKNIYTEVVVKPKKILFGKVEFNILFPDQSFVNKEISNVNDSSIVIKLVYASTSIMLIGDYENEESLVGKTDLTADILKIGHHGSDNANSFEFLEAVGPRYATISSGADNKFGHPHLAVLNNLKRLGVEIFRTDLVGDIIFSSNGQEFSYYLKNN